MPIFGTSQASFPVNTKDGRSRRDILEHSPFFLSFFLSFFLFSGLSNLSFLFLSLPNKGSCIILFCFICIHVTNLFLQTFRLMWESRNSNRPTRPIYSSPYYRFLQYSRKSLSCEIQHWKMCIPTILIQIVFFEFFCYGFHPTGQN